MNKNRFLSLLLALTMAFLCVPAGMFAEGGDEVAEEAVQSAEQVVEEVASEPAAEDAIPAPVEEAPATEPAVETPAQEPAVEAPAQEAAVEEPAPETVVKETDSEPVAEEQAAEPVEEATAEVNNDAETVESVVEEPIAENTVTDAVEAELDSPFILEGDVLKEYTGEEEKVTVPEGVRVIADNAFKGNTVLKQIILPDSVEEIGASAFEDCANLEKVSVKDIHSLKIGADAFKGTKVELEEKTETGEETAQTEVQEGETAVEAPVAAEPVKEEAVIAEPETEIAVETPVAVETVAAAAETEAIAEVESAVEEIVPEETVEEATVIEEVELAVESVEADLDVEEIVISETTEVETTADETKEQTAEISNVSGTDVVTPDVAFATAAPTIKTQPTDAEGNVGDVVGFSVKAENAKGYQWQIRKTATGAWVDLSGKTKSTLEITLNSNNIQFAYRVVVSGEEGTTPTVSNAVMVKEPAPAVSLITLQPTDAEGKVGEQVTFLVVAEGATSYQWQIRKTATGVWADLSGKTEPELKITLNSNNIKFAYRVVVRGENGTDESDAVVVKEPTAASLIKTQPTDAEGEVGGQVTFSVVAENATGYQWQIRKTATGAWADLSGKTEPELKITLNSNNIKFAYRVVVSGENGTDESDVVVVKKPASASLIKTQPTDAEGKIGDKVIFSVVAENATGYQWQIRKTADGSWSNLSGKTGPTLTITLNSTNIKFAYRVVVSGKDGKEESNAVVVETSGAAVTIKTQPVNAEGKVGDQVSFSVVAENATGYQWQIRKTAEGGWTNLSGKTKDTLEITLNSTNIKFAYRVVVSGGNGTSIESKEVKVETLVVEPTIKTQPESVTAKIGDTISFTVVAENAESYQWMYCKNGTWAALKGKTDSTLTLTLNATNIAFQYYCVVNGAEGTTPVNSDIVEIINNYFTASGVEYQILEDGTSVRVTGYSGSAAQVSIPTHPVNPNDKTKTFTVTEVGEEAFMNQSISAITLPNTVTVIRARAFKGCSNLATMNTRDD